MIGLLIDPTAREITPLEVSDWTSIAPALGCSTFTVVQLDEQSSLYLDDEGLLSYPNPLGYFSLNGQVFAGRGLVLGLDPNTGDSCDVEEYMKAALPAFIEWLDTPSAEDVEPRMEFVAWDS